MCECAVLSLGAKSLRKERTHYSLVKSSVRAAVCDNIGTLLLLLLCRFSSCSLSFRRRIFLPSWKLELIDSNTMKPLAASPMIQDPSLASTSRHMHLETNLPLVLADCRRRETARSCLCPHLQWASRMKQGSWRCLLLRPCKRHCRGMTLQSATCRLMGRNCKCQLRSVP